jgi:hypothetical protein
MLRLLAHLSVDMPGLLKLDGEIVHEQRPIINRRDEPENGEILMPDDFPTRPPGRPDYVGLIGFLHSFSLLEIPLSWIALIWSLCLAEWLLAAVLVVFAWAMFRKRGMMEQREPNARWFGVGAYLALWVFVRAYYGGQEYSAVQSGGLFNLRMILSWWSLILGGLTLICFNYAVSMRSAPNKQD